MRNQRLAKRLYGVNRRYAGGLGTALGTDFGYRVAMPKRSRRRSAKPILVGSSPTATSNLFIVPLGHGDRIRASLVFRLRRSKLCPPRFRRLPDLRSRSGRHYPFLP